MFSQVLVPMDGSTASFNALDQALQIATPGQTVITALYVIDVRVLDEACVYLPVHDEIKVSDDVVPPEKARMTYQAWAEQVTAKARERGESAGVEVHTQIVTGIPYQEVISRSPEFDLLVMGLWKKAAGDYPGPFLAGTTLQHVIARTRLPALCVPDSGSAIRSILAAYDGSREAIDALQLCATWAHAQEMTLVVLTVQEDGDQAQTLLKEARERVRPVVPKLIARDGDPATVILAVAEEHDCDVIAVGVPANLSTPIQPREGLVATLLHTSPRPLLLSH